jgi:hypothetical protein
LSNTSLVIAVDFDGTIVQDQFPFIGPEIPGAVLALHLLRKQGHKLILLTCREGEHLADACAWLRKRGIIPDAVNENLPGIPWEPRKVLYDALIDDRAVGCPMRQARDGKTLPDWLEIQRMLGNVQPVIVRDADGRAI